MDDGNQGILCVVGLGLMGGSLAAAARASGKYNAVVGFDVARDEVELALQRGLIDEAVPCIEEGVQQADVIVLAAPVRQIVACIDQIARCATSPCAVLDLGSTKREILQAMASLPEGIAAVGGHPMCGGSHHGAASARADLYMERVFALCAVPAREGPAPWAEELVRSIGAQPLWLDAIVHDRAVALVSHLPFALSSMLMGTVASRADDDDPAWKLAAGGLRTMTSLAGGDGEMWRDILLSNRDMMIELLRGLRRSASELEAMLEREDADALEGLLAHAKERRRHLDTKRSGEA